jgi:hypothetical protein
MSNQTKDKWADYVPVDAVKAVTYAGCVFWYNDDDEIIFQETDGAETFRQWVEETGAWDRW